MNANSFPVYITGNLTGRGKLFDPKEKHNYL